MRRQNVEACHLFIMNGLHESFCNELWQVLMMMERDAYEEKRE